MKKVILFDYDDTLVDTVGSRVPAIIEYCKVAHGLVIDENMIKAVWGLPFTKKFAALGCPEPVDIERYKALSARFPMRPFDEVGEITLKLSRSHTLAILSSASREVIVNDLKALGWNDNRFVRVFGQEDCSFHKPDPRVFDSVLNFLGSSGFQRSQVMYVGDSDSDAKAATLANIDFVGIARDPGRAALFRENSVRFKPSLRELAQEVLHSISLSPG